jgi:hypothetical protein
MQIKADPHHRKLFRKYGYILLAWYFIVMIFASLYE